jgi:hypothetical protein
MGDEIPGSEYRGVMLSIVKDIQTDVRGMRAQIQALSKRQSNLEGRAAVIGGLAGLFGALAVSLIVWIITGG